MHLNLTRLSSSNVEALLSYLLTALENFRGERPFFRFAPFALVSSKPYQFLEARGWKLEIVVLDINPRYLIALRRDADDLTAKIRVGTELVQWKFRWFPQAMIWSSQTTNTSDRTKAHGNINALPMPAPLENTDVVANPLLLILSDAFCNPSDVSNFLSSISVMSKME